MNVSRALIRTIIELARKCNSIEELIAILESIANE